MKIPFRPGQQQVVEFTVTEDKLARFQTGLVHPVYSTFALGQDAEWACRQFVLQMKEDGEEGIGSYLSVQHESPAALGARVRIVATLLWVEGNKIRCRYEAFCGERRLAFGETEQRIIEKAKFDALLGSL